MKNFNLIAQLNKEMQDFDQNKINIADASTQGNARHLKQKAGG